MRDYEERLKHLNRQLSQPSLGMARGRTVSASEVKKQYSHAKDAFKSIHMMTSIPFDTTVQKSQDKS